MGTPLSTLISALEKANEEIIVSGTTTSNGGLGYIIDTARSEADDYWPLCLLYIKDSSETSIIGEEREITGNTSSNGRVDVAPNFSAVVPSGTEYEIRRKQSREKYKVAVNFAVLGAQGWRNEMDVDDSYIVLDDVLDYDFPTGLLFLSEVWIEQRRLLYKRTATGGAVGYLEDTEAHFDSGPNPDNERVAIYGGTGAGQSRTVSSHTDGQLIPDSNFNPAPDETSKYVVKVTSKDELAPVPIVGFRPDMAGRVIRFAAEPAYHGQTILIIYEKAPVELVNEADETSIPERYIVLQAMVKISADIRDEGDRRFWVEFYQTQAEIFKAHNPPFRLPMRQTIYPGEGGVQSEWPYGNPLWS